MRTPQSILEEAFAQAKQSHTELLSPEQNSRVALIVSSAETQKAVIAALITSLTKKIETPAQDVRRHKVELPGGYSGRVYDTLHITPFIRQHFPRLAMKSGSGWLTRSIEQLHSFTLDFPGRIQNPAVKAAFLEILHDVEENSADARAYLVMTFHALSRYQQAGTFDITSMDVGGVTISAILRLLDNHINSRYSVAGASRLPVIAIYSIYELLLHSISRYTDKHLVLLKSHTASDLKSHTIGDVEIITAKGSFFEAVEVKHQMPITLALVEDAFDKIRSLPVHRYYLLTTAEPNTKESEAIEQFVQSVRANHGCEMVINGVMPTLKYYLRLLNEPGEFLSVYERNLLADYEANTDIKKSHIERWITLRENLRG